MLAKQKNIKKVDEDVKKSQKKSPPPLSKKLSPGKSSKLNTPGKSSKSAKSPAKIEKEEVYVGRIGAHNQIRSHNTGKFISKIDMRKIKKSEDEEDLDEILEQIEEMEAQ